jgi:hypothetical protein
MFMGGLEGQIYILAPGLDRALPDSPGTTIPFNIGSRSFGEEQSQYSPSVEAGIPLMEPTQVNQIMAVFDAPVGSDMTIYGYCDDESDNIFSTPINIDVTGGWQTFRASVEGVQGVRVVVGLMGNASGQVAIKALACDVAKRAIEN